MIQPNTCPLLTICDPKAYMANIKAILTEAATACKEARVNPEYDDKVIQATQALGAAAFLTRRNQAVAPAAEHYCPLSLTFGGA